MTVEHNKIIYNISMATCFDLARSEDIIILYITMHNWIYDHKIVMKMFEYFRRYKQIFCN
jgi:hypothetical protein